MVLKPKYSGANITFEIEESFLEDLEEIGESYSDDIFKQMHYLCDTLENMRNEIQIFAGVSHVGEPLFFEISVLNEKKRYPFFIKVSRIDPDAYLDYMLLGKTLKKNIE